MPCPTGHQTRACASACCEASPSNERRRRGRGNVHEVNTPCCQCGNFEIQAGRVGHHQLPVVVYENGECLPACGPTAAVALVGVSLRMGRVGSAHGPDSRRGRGFGRHRTHARHTGSLACWSGPAISGFVRLHECPESRSVQKSHLREIGDGFVVPWMWHGYPPQPWSEGSGSYQLAPYGRTFTVRFQVGRS